MTTYTKYSLVPNEDHNEGKYSKGMISAFDYKSVFNYSSAFDYNSQTSGQYQSAFDYGYGNTQSNSSDNENEKEKRTMGLSIMNCISTILTVASYMIIGVTFPITVWFCIKKLQQWERLIVFRLGHLQRNRGPGIVFIIPWLDQYKRVDMRTKAFSVPPQQLITVDNGIIEMGCEVKYRVCDVEKVTITVTSPEPGLRSYGKTVLLNVLTKHTVKDLERDRLLLATEILKQLNCRVVNWGIEIGEVELSTVNILKEPEPDNPLKPILGALGNPGASTMATLPSIPMTETSHSNASTKSSLLDFGTLAKMSGLSGFQGFSASPPDNKKGKIEPPADTTTTPKTKLGRYLQAMISGPSGANLSNGVYRLQVEGKESGVFCIFISTGIRQVVEGDMPQLAPDVSVVISIEDLTAVLEGTLPPLQAYLSGRLTVQGNFQLLMGFDSLRQATSSDKDDIFIV